MGSSIVEHFFAKNYARVGVLIRSKGTLEINKSQNTLY